MYVFYRALQITSRFFGIIANVTHLRINLRTCVVPKNPLGPFLRLYWSCQDRLGGLFWPNVVADYVGPAHKTVRYCMLEDLPETDSGINILATR